LILLLLLLLCAPFLLCVLLCCCCIHQGVSGAVRRRMLLTAQHPELELRPMLLFPEVREMSLCCFELQSIWGGWCLVYVYRPANPHEVPFLETTASLAIRFKVHFMQSSTPSWSCGPCCCFQR
jgi:hypothetical protein